MIKLNWIFDAAKLRSPPDQPLEEVRQSFYATMYTVIENLNFDDLSDDVLSKFQAEDSEELESLLLSQIEEIFSVL